MGKHHYRQEWSYDESELEEAEENARLIREAVAASGGEGHSLDASWARVKFEQAMEDDLDTVGAVVTLVSLAQEIVESADEGLIVATAQGVLREMGYVFGLMFGEETDRRVKEGWGKHLQRFS